jgi:hypothetical protein
MPFSLDNLDATVSQATHPEELRDILVLIFREVAMRWNGNRTKKTGFEAATEEELELSFFRTVNELLIRWGRLQDQLGNVVVSIHIIAPCFTQSFPKSFTESRTPLLISQTGTQNFNMNCISDMGSIAWVFSVGRCVTYMRGNGS